MCAHTAPDEIMDGDAESLNVEWNYITNLKKNTFNYVIAII